MIIAFPKIPSVIISSQLVTETRRVSSNGTAVIRHNPPVQRFFLDFEDSEGSCGVWDGPSYADALVAAREWVTDGVAILDRTHENWGRA